MSSAHLLINTGNTEDPVEQLIGTQPPSDGRELVPLGDPEEHLPAPKLAAFPREKLKKHECIFETAIEILDRHGIKTVGQAEKMAYEAEHGLEPELYGYINKHHKRELHAIKAVVADALIT